MVVEARGLKDGGLERLVERHAFEGVLRNIWWEGLDEATFSALKAKGAHLAPDAQLLELDAKSTDDRTIAIMILSLLALIIGGVALAVKPARV